jgi:ElaB/YqjD/DUF883 family membrane-anchored ribosome-binding protein
MSSRDTTPQEWQPGSSFQGSTTGWDTPSSTGTGEQSTMDRAKDAVGMGQEKAGQMADQATAKADAGMDKAASGLDRAAETIRERGESMGGGTVADAATMAADRLEQGAQFLRENDTDQLIAELEALVRRKPVESLLVAAGVGFLLSKALR